jgi:uncharacterized membrane protein YhaH (DUF805 family)
MQHIIHLFFDFDGKIRRLDYWMGLLAVCVTSLGAMLLFEPGYLNGEINRPVVAAAVTVLFAVPELAICVKRFNDLEWPQWFAYALVVPCAAVSIILITGMTKEGTVANAALCVVATVLALAELIPCGFIKGRSTASIVGAS